MTPFRSLRRAALASVLATSGLGACAALDSGADSVEPNPFRIVDDSARLALDVFDGEQPVLSYCYGDQLPEGVPEDRTRSSYAHPIFGLDGEMLTDDFPADHLHHRGLSMMWPRMKVDEEVCQLWHIYGIRSLVREWKFEHEDGQPARLHVHNAWVMDDGTEVARETVHYAFHEANEVGREICVDYRIDVLDAPITLQGAETKGYGGLNLRFAPRTDTVITTDQGLAKDSDRARFAWADLSAKFAGREETSGIAILVRPAHPDFPPPWTLRHYGDLNVAWPGIEPLVLEPGTTVELPYCLWIHRGGILAADVATIIANHHEDPSR